MKILKEVRILLFSASILIDTQFFTQMDPYLKITLGDSSLYSQVIKKGGKNPRWNGQEFLFQNCGQNDIFTFTLMDKDLIFDDFIGQKQVRVQQLKDKNHKLIEVLSKDKSQVTGRVVIHSKIKQVMKLKNVFDVERQSECEKAIQQFPTSPQIPELH